MVTTDGVAAATISVRSVAVTPWRFAAATAPGVADGDVTAALPLVAPSPATRATVEPEARTAERTDTATIERSARGSRRAVGRSRRPGTVVPAGVGDPRRGRGVDGGVGVHRPKRFGDDGFLVGHRRCSGFRVW